MKPAYTIHPCTEKWSAMTPNADGTRHCASCNKNLVDFRTMRWKEIVRLQQASGNSLCGVYSRSQFKQSPRSSSFFSSAWLTATSLVLWLSSPRESSASTTSSAYIALPLLQPDNAQPQDTTLKNTIPQEPAGKRMVIRGRVTAQQQEGDSSVVTGIPKADIELQGTSLYLTTDSLGYFEMDISDYRFAPGKQPVLRVSHYSYESQDVTVIRDYLLFNEELHIQLQYRSFDDEDVSGGIGAYYSEPSWFDRLCNSLGW